jgi:hypothetical protein
MLFRGCAVLILLPAGLLGGCATRVGAPHGANDNSNNALVSEVAAKATEVAGLVGGTNGFGGPMMDGFEAHCPANIGFDGAGDLANSNGTVACRFFNESSQACTFHLGTIASYAGLNEQTRDVDVPAGEDVTVDVPCAEIMGLGPLDRPGGVGCGLADGTTVANTLAVPGFLGLDYTCGGTYTCYLTPDVNDLNGNGDTQELILLSEAMQLHMQNGGPMGHRHGVGPGMMGPHMGMGF